MSMRNTLHLGATKAGVRKLIYIDDKEGHKRITSQLKQSKHSFVRKKKTSPGYICKLFLDRERLTFKEPNFLTLNGSKRICK